MLVECTNCGAPLDVTPTSRLVTCAYCDKKNVVAKMTTMQLQTPARWAPPRQWTPPYHVPASSHAPLLLHAQKSSSSR
jgi:LSD1 subclass zinc finger protein